MVAGAGLEPASLAYETNLDVEKRSPSPVYPAIVKYFLVALTGVEPVSYPYEGYVITTYTIAQFKGRRVFNHLFYFTPVNLSRWPDSNRRPLAPKASA